MFEKSNLTFNNQPQKLTQQAKSLQGVFDSKSGQIISYEQLEKQGNQLVNYLLKNFPKIKSNGLTGCYTPSFIAWRTRATSSRVGRNPKPAASENIIR